MGSWFSSGYNKDLPVKDDGESQPATTEPRNQNYTINNELGTPKQIHKERDINRRKIKGSWFSEVYNKYFPVKDDEESQPATTKPRNQNDPIEIELGILNQRHEESDINRRTEPRTEINTINNELGTPKQLHKESDINRRKIKGSWFSDVYNKYFPVKDDGESQPTTTKPRNQNDPIEIELGILNQKHEESVINRRTEPRTEIDTINNELGTQKQLHKESDINRRKIMVSWWSGVKNIYLPVKDDEESQQKTNTDGQEYLMKQKDLKILALEEQVKKLTAEKESLLFSQICCVKLSDGNPNITDLSDANRADKLTGRFSELYDNQWTDSFQALCESKSILEENAIRDLLHIVLEISKSLQSSVDPEVYKICQDYITECTEVCWLMCVKSPPMHISADKTDTFQHHLYTGYTTSGKYVSYVVWPTLFQYKDGPIMQRGVAQGTNNKL